MPATTPGTRLVFTDGTFLIRFGGGSHSTRLNRRDHQIEHKTQSRNENYIAPPSRSPGSCRLERRRKNSNDLQASG